MNQARPFNHAAPQRHSAPPQPAFPPIDATLLEALEAAYPPRCLHPRETVEDHLRYAGQVDLVARLRAEHDARLQTAVDPEEDLEPDVASILRDGERASA